MKFEKCGHEANMGKKGWARVKETFNWREVVSRITEEFEKDFV